MAKKTVKHALFLTPKAAIISGALVYRTEADEFILEVQQELAEDLTKHLIRHRFRSKVDIAGSDLAVGSFQAGDSASTNIPGQSQTLFSLTPAWGIPMQSVITHESLRPQTDTSFDADSAIGLHARRIATGTPWLTDMQPGRMPAEVGAVDLAVSFEKGCYLGQEPVARLHWRGKPNRTLCIIELEDPLPFDSPWHPSYSLIDGNRFPLHSATRKDVGWITSWSPDPNAAGDHDRFVALAILRREVSAGDELSIGSSETGYSGTARVITR